MGLIKKSLNQGKFFWLGLWDEVRTEIVKNSVPFLAV